jgi:hypothetical protein
MAEIRNVDRAWEAIDVFRGALCQAQAEVERLGGKDPAAQCPNDGAASSRRLELRRRCNAVIDSLLAPINLTILIAAYKQTQEYAKLKYKTRRDYATRMRRIESEIGKLPLRDVVSEDMEKWRARWSSNGTHPAMGNAVMTVLRILLRFGAKELGDKECGRLALHEFPGLEKLKKGERKQISVSQLDALRAQAHKMGFHTLALGVAIQYEVQLSQKQLIGHWVPMSDPGTSDVSHNDKKWLGGLDWSQIDADRFLYLWEDGKEIKLDLNLFPMVIEELRRLPKIPDSGPIIVYEPTGIPYLENEYHTRWRKVANAVGIPKSIRNTYHPKRDRAEMPLDKQRACDIATRVCQSLPMRCRNGVLSEMVADLLEKKITPEKLSAAKSKYVTAYYRKFESGYTPSLDQVAGGLRLGDTISSDHNAWQG